MYLKINAARRPVDTGISIRAEITGPDDLAIELRKWKQKTGNLHSANGYLLT